jgi:1,4-dihydroxy-2-naphthoate octaprenyltransferase
MPSLSVYAGVARTPFLALPVTLVAVGASAAAYDGAFRWSHTVVGLIGLLAAHVAVNVLNEWSDLRTGIDLRTVPTPFSGGSGTLPSGALSPRAAFRFGLAASAVALAVGLWFVARVGWVILPFVVVGGSLVFGYTEGLARHGLGEMAAGLGLGGLPVAGAALIQDGALGPAAIAAAVPATLMTFNLLLINEFPDEAADREGGRRHLVILLGRIPAARLYAIAGLLTPAAVVAGIALDALPTMCLVAVAPSLLLVKPLAWALSAPAGDVPIPALGANVVWNLSTNLVLAVSLVVARLW